MLSMNTREELASLRLRHVVRFCATSGVTTLVSSALLLLLYGQRLIGSEVAASAVANLSVAPLAYYLNRHWAWSKTGPSHLKREVLPFYALTVLGLAASLAAAALVRSVVSTHHLGHDHATIILDAANLGAYGLVWLVKLVVFNKIFSPNKTNELV